LHFWKSEWSNCSDREMVCFNQKLMWKPTQQASNGYPLFQICHLYTAHAFYRMQDHSGLWRSSSSCFFCSYWKKSRFCLNFYTSRDAELEKLGAATTLRSIGLSTKPFSSELTLAQPYAMRTAAQPPTSTTSIPDSAREDLPNDTHVISFQRKLYGTFTKQSCLGLVWQRLSNVPECSRTAITVVLRQRLNLKYTH